MKYLKLFNEGSKFDDLKGKPAGYIIWGKITIFEKKIEELNYIINDIGGDVALHCGSNNGAGKLSISLEPRIMQYSGNIESVADSLDEAWKWVENLAINESYLEWIDRIEEIIQDSGYEIYTERTQYYSRKKETLHQNCFKFNFLTIRNLEKEKYGIGKSIPIKKALEEEYEMKHMTIPGKIKKWFKSFGRSK